MRTANRFLSHREQARHLPGFLLSATLALFALPSFAGVITVEFTSNVLNADGSHGPRDTAVNGVISFELADLSDRDASPEVAVFADGQRVQTDLGWAARFTVEFTSGRQAGSEVAGGSAQLRIENSPQGDSLAISTRSLTYGNQRFGQLFDLNLGGGPELFAGSAPVPDNLASLEDFLLSFDNNQITSATAISRLFSVEDTLRISSISISAVPEPGVLGLLGLGLVIFRRRQLIYCAGSESAKIGFPGRTMTGSSL